jgi:hypothetical protein
LDAVLEMEFGEDAGDVVGDGVGPEVRKVAHGDVTLEDVFIGLTGSEIRA